LHNSGSGKGEPVSLAGRPGCFCWWKWLFSPFTHRQWLVAAKEARVSLSLLSDRRRIWASNPFCFSIFVLLLNTIIFYHCFLFHIKQIKKKSCWIGV
jgi:hypothetical protein